MITFDSGDSPFYKQNRSYCEFVESQFKGKHVECSGFCDSFRFLINAKWSKNKHSYELKINQDVNIDTRNVQGGITMPIPGSIFSWTAITLDCFDTQFEISYRKSWLSRLFMSKSLKEMLPSPYFISVSHDTDKTVFGNLLMFLKRNNITEFELSKGKLRVISNVAVQNPLSLIEDIEQTTKQWA